MRPCSCRAQILSPRQPWYRGRYYDTYGDTIPIPIPKVLLIPYYASGIVHRPEFRQKLIWLGIPPPTPASRFASSLIVTNIVEVDSGDSNKALSNEDNNLINKDLLELYCRVFLYNARKATKMVYKGSKKLIYKVGQIVLLTIPLKNRLSAKATYLPYCILIVIKGAYTLLS
jgi:hypothetical protein